MVVYPEHRSPHSYNTAAVTAQTAAIRCSTVELMCELMDISLAYEKDKSTEASFIKDIEDVRLSRGGDPDAFRRLVERHQNYVGRILWRFSRDMLVHEELVQDAFVEAYLSLHTYRRKAPLRNWLARIATRVGYRYWKKTDRAKKRQIFNLRDRNRLDNKEAETTEPERAAEILHSLLEQLPPRDRLVLTLRYIEQCDVSETARRTGWTRSMVKVQSLRARKKLKNLFDKSEKEVEL